MTIANNLQAIVAAKTAIVAAVNSKGGDLSVDPPISVIAPAITALPEGGGGEWDGVIPVAEGATSANGPGGWVLDFAGRSVTVGGSSNRWPQNWPIVGVRNGKNIKIGTYAFSVCSALVNVDGLSGVTGTIGTYAFYNCSSLVNVDGLSGVTGSIGTSAFYGCSSLTDMWTAATSFTSPTATSGQFYGCKNLTEIHLTAPVMCVIGGTTDYDGLPASFRDCPAHIIVPDNLLADYQADARWALMDAAGRLWTETEWSNR